MGVSMGKPQENHRKMMENGGLPSDKHTKNYGIWTITISFGGKSLKKKAIFQ